VIGLYGKGSDRFAELCDSLHVGSDDLIFLHISYTRMSYLGLSAEEIIDALLQRLGPKGTLVLPSYAWHLDKTARPWRGYADYFAQRPAFDVRHTPANIGWVPEVFRQMPGVKRSSSYWWSVAAKGALARELTEGQAQVVRPYGTTSSFGRLAGAGAKIVGLGVSLNTSSLALVADDAFGDRHVQAVFTGTPESGVVIDEDGRRIETHSYWLLPEVVRVIKPSSLIAASPRLMAAMRRVDRGTTIHFSYAYADYHQEALRLGEEAIAAGRPMPWLQDYPLKHEVAQA
jgi:aminoglycoside N3'-acetyltransferase